MHIVTELVEKKVKTIDELLTDSIGEFGRYQGFILLLVAVQYMFITCTIMSPIFVVAAPDHWCSVPHNMYNTSCTQKQLKKILIPKEFVKGQWVHSKCSIYAYSEENITRLCTENDDVNVSSAVTMETKGCESWEYEESHFTNTVATEVRY